MPREDRSLSLARSGSVARIRELVPENPYVRLRLDDSTVEHVLIDAGCSAGPAIAWSSMRPDGERWGIGCTGPTPALVSLLEQLHQDQPLDGVTVPAGDFEYLPPHLTSPRPGHWSLWELDEGAEPDAGAACHLDPADVRIRDLLAHSTSAHVFPGDRPATWAGVLLDGILVSVGAEIREPSGLAHLVSICTHPSARGQGLAGSVIGWLVQRARAQDCRAVMLEMYAANESGRRAYQRAGFTELGQYRSGLIPAALSSTALTKTDLTKTDLTSAGLRSSRPKRARR
ncbi:MAG: GNAT family N-acetyltransferase [Actinomycetales bacterium]